MDKYRDCHTERSNSDKERQMLYDINYMRTLKKKKKRYKQIYLQNRNRVTNIENKLMTLPGIRG